MKLTFLEPLYAEPGPVACVYLDTSRDIDDPQRAIDLRWRHLRETLAAQGADTPTLSVLAAEVGADEEVSGRHGQAIFAGHGRLILEEELPEPPVRDTARLDALPDAMPLAIQHAPDIPYAAVSLHRVQPEGDGGAQELEVDFQAGRWPTSRVAPPRRVHRRGPVDDWPRDAARIATELEDLANRSDVEFVVMRGDSWARNTLFRRLPRHLCNRVVTVAGDGKEAVAPGRALLEDELGRLFEGQLSAWDQTRMETFLAQRAQHGNAVEGMTAVVSALQRGQASALLVNTPAQFSRPLWAGPEPTQIALSPRELQSFGIPSPEEEPAGAALIRALVRTGAELVAVPRQRVPLEDGVGVLLRYFDRGT